MKFECLLSLVPDYFITRSDGKFAYSSGTSIGELLGESQMKDFPVGRVFGAHFDAMAVIGFSNGDG